MTLHSDAIVASSMQPLSSCPGQPHSPDGRPHAAHTPHEDGGYPTRASPGVAFPQSGGFFGGQSQEQFGESSDIAASSTQVRDQKAHRPKRSVCSLRRACPSVQNERAERQALMQAVFCEIAKFFISRGFAYAKCSLSERKKRCGSVRKTTP
jgi:hypothetical protein